MSSQLRPFFRSDVHSNDSVYSNAVSYPKLPTYCSSISSSIDESDGISDGYAVTFSK